MAINSSRKYRKHIDKWKLSNILLNDGNVEEEFMTEIKKKFLELNGDGKRIEQNLCDTGKAVLKEKCISLSF